MELPSDDDGMSAPMLISAAKPKAAVKKRARVKKTTTAESKPSKVLAKGSRQSPRQPANASSSLFVSAPRLPDPDMGLPPDDDGDVDFVTSGSISKPHAPVISKARGKPKKNKDMITAVSKGRGDEGDTFPWTHETLKIAASEIPSVISMPYEDLKAMLANPRPLNSCSERCTIWEIYSVPRLGPRVRELGGSSRRSYDLRHFWDLQMDSYRRLLLSDCSQLRPFYLSLSPPCKFLCQLMSSNWSRMKSAKKYISLADACSHIDLCMWLAKFQHESGAYFGFEHPQGSLAWSRDSVPRPFLTFFLTSLGLFWGWDICSPTPITFKMGPC